MKSLKAVASLSIFGGAAALGIYIYWRACKNIETESNKKNQEETKLKWEPVGKVVKLLVYPVKSCKGISAQAAEAEHLGLIHKGIGDRSFIIVSEKGTPVSGRIASTTVLIEATFEKNILTLKYPGSEDIQVNTSCVVKNGREVKADVWGKSIFGMDCGEDVSQWLQRNLKRKCKLLLYADVPTSRVAEHPLKHRLLRGDDHSLYADMTPYMLMTNESLADLQSRMSCRIAVEDFRPNIVVEGAPKPYDEDEWQCIKIGGAILRNAVPCSRCVFTTISSKTGKKNPGMEPLRTLKTYRCKDGSEDPYFGINLVLYVAGKVSVGDEVFITRGTISTE